MPKRVQRERRKGWKKPEGAIYVGRPSPWGNLFRPGHRYIMDCFPGMIIEDPLDRQGITVYTVQQSLNLFRMYAELRNALDPGWLKPLKGNDVMCWCAPEELCHGDILLELMVDDVIWSKANPVPKSLNGWRWERHRIEVKL